MAYTASKCVQHAHYFHVCTQNTNLMLVPHISINILCVFYGHGLAPNCLRVELNKSRYGQNAALSSSNAHLTVVHDEWISWWASHGHVHHEHSSCGMSVERIYATHSRSLIPVRLVMFIMHL